MLTATNLTKSFGTRTLFAGAGLRLGGRDRVALVGPNGSGKTTLLEILAGLQAPDAGVVQTTKGAEIGYLAQETDVLGDGDVLSVVVSGGTAMREAGHRLAVLEEELSQTPEGAERDALLAEYAGLQDRFEALGGWTAEAEARRILGGLGFSEKDQERRCTELSGGWRMRVALARILLQAPDVLLLDEPTNHLDLESVVWLERFLSGYDGSVLLVSHDRDFMNATCTRVVEIDGGDLVSYSGNFEHFVVERAARRERQAREAKDQAKRVAEVEAFISRFRYKASKARQVQSRIKMLEKMERVGAPNKARRAMSVGFPPPPRSGRVVASLEGVDFSYGDVKVYEGLDIEIERGEKIALVGPNGAGKTTLLKLLAGALQPQGGRRRLGHNVSCGYFAQHAVEQLDGRNRVLAELHGSIPPGTDVKARDLLGRFLFSGDDVDKPVSVLSGGERTRLAMAKLLVEPHNFLCLDEPTNHLDIPSRDVLELALDDYAGAMVLITHDRHLIRSIANRIVEVRDGRVRSYPGDYESYLWHVEQSESADGDGGTAGVTAVRTKGLAGKDRRRVEAAERARLKKHRDDVARVEAELDAVAARVRQLEAQLGDPAFYSKGGDEVVDAAREHAKLAERVTELEAAWEKAAEALEGAQAGR